MATGNFIACCRCFNGVFAFTGTEKELTRRGRVFPSPKFKKKMKKAKLFTYKRKNIILKYLRRNRELTDMECSVGLIAIPEISEMNLKEDSLRRYLAVIRDWENLREVFPKKDIKKEIQRLIKLYPKSSIVSTAEKLKLKFPELQFKTLLNYICNYVNHNDF